MQGMREYLKLQKAIEQAPIVVPCQNTDPDLWFGLTDGDGLETQANYKIAKQLCAMCPVNKICLEYALVAGEPEGVWGGLTPHERKLMRRASERNFERRKYRRKWN